MELKMSNVEIIPKKIKDEETARLVQCRSRHVKSPSQLDFLPLFPPLQRGPL